MRRGLALIALATVVAATTGCAEQVASTEGVATSSSLAPSSSTASTAPPTTVPESTSTTSTSTSTTSTTTTSTTTTTLPPVPTTTSCEQVVHIGDSTSVPLFQPSSVGGSEFTAEAQYKKVGVDVVYPDNSGARSIVETLGAEPNAADVAQAVRDNGYHGCWVLMIGTNDAANIAAGSTVNAETRIRRMLDIIGSDPVLWVDAVTQATDDAYRNASMLSWDQELYRVVAQYPNARVFKWYDVVKAEWFRNDGIHYTVEGSAQRAALTAQALVAFFPATA